MTPKILAGITFLCLSYALNAQIPLTITEFDFEETPLIDIAVGDLDANGKTDIYIIGEGAQQIFRLTNLGNGTNFIKTPYFSLDKQPTSMGTISWNGGDDMYYTLKGEEGMFTLYGKDPLINEKKSGAVLLDTVGGLTQADLQPFDHTQMLMSSDTAGKLYFLQIVFGSFNYIFPRTSSSLSMMGDPGEISSFGTFDTIDFFVPNVTTGQLMTGEVVFNGMTGDPIYEDQLEVLDDQLVHPLSSMTYSATIDNRMLFVLDTGSNEIYKYVFDGGSFTKSTLDASFTSPSMMALGFVDNDTFPDLVVADGPSLWLLSNVPSRSNGVQAELIVTYDEPISEFVLTDFDGDGIDDIASVPVSRNKVLVARNDILSATQEIVAEPFGYYPNPASSEFYFSGHQIPDAVRMISTNGQLYTPEISAGKISLVSVPSGFYIVQTEVEGKVFVDRISVLASK
jgi:hypothetical protein